jgi:hypothetical protein
MAGLGTKISKQGGGKTAPKGAAPQDATQTSPTQTDGLSAQSPDQQQTNNDALPGQAMQNASPEQKQQLNQQAQTAPAEILDLSNVQTFGEAYRQARAAGAQVFRWKPNRFGNDVYSTDTQQQGGNGQPRNTPDSNGQPPQSMQQGGMQQGQMQGEQMQAQGGGQGQPPMEGQQTQSAQQQQSRPAQGLNTKVQRQPNRK